MRMPPRAEELSLGADARDGQRQSCQISTSVCSNRCAGQLGNFGSDACGGGGCGHAAVDFLFATGELVARSGPRHHPRGQM